MRHSGDRNSNVKFLHNIPYAREGLEFGGAGHYICCHGSETYLFYFFARCLANLITSSGGDLVGVV